jgi:hypothetical protein
MGADIPKFAPKTRGGRLRSNAAYVHHVGGGRFRVALRPVGKWWSPGLARA